MRLIKYGIIFSVIVVLVLYYFLHSKEKTITLPMDTLYIPHNCTIIPDSTWLTRPVKYLHIIKGRRDRSFVELLTLSDTVLDRYRNDERIALFYCVITENRDQICNEIDEMDFDYPVFMYTPEVFEEQIYLSDGMVYVSYLMDKKNTIIAMTNPSLPGFFDLIESQFPK